MFFILESTAAASAASPSSSAHLDFRESLVASGANGIFTKIMRSEFLAPCAASRPEPVRLLSQDMKHCKNQISTKRPLCWQPPAEDGDFVLVVVGGTKTRWYQYMWLGGDAPKW